jgi:hypothetical protein
MSLPISLGAYKHYALAVKWRFAALEPYFLSNSLIMNLHLYPFIVLVATKLYSDTIHHLILHLQANGIANSS